MRKKLDKNFLTIFFQLRAEEMTEAAPEDVGRGPLIFEDTLERPRMSGQALSILP